MARPKSLNRSSRAKLLTEAEKLFAARGFSSVKLRDIAVASGLHHASIYHYFPGGKEQIYVDVMTASFHEHRRGLEEAVATAPSGVREPLYAVADWFTSHPPVDVARMALADFPALHSAAADELAELAYDSLRGPIAAALNAARDAPSEALSITDPDQAAMALVSLVQSVHSVPARYLPTLQARTELGRGFVDMLLDGWIRREQK
ncbi:TetR/AcrR family transcriptional regulator [Arthrobacter antioxidans]|uniref:TetR/AcrR family transcriptional regulator n=1 Tax=Arthrobacter antioxidans TaxID=2895818 RepID=UPI001FFEC2EC|nr:TetR/AcrR family transcriptional regulator [Arthrobacter antioxidans]